MENGRVDPSIYTIRKMKRCPFCGRDDMIVYKYQQNLFGVVCKCGLESPHDSRSIEATVRVWNRRRGEINP